MQHTFLATAQQTLHADQLCSEPMAMEIKLEPETAMPSIRYTPDTSELPKQVYLNSHEDSSRYV